MILLPQNAGFNAGVQNFILPLHSSSRYVEDLGVLNFQPVMSYRLAGDPPKYRGKTGVQIPPKYNTMNIPPTKASRNSSKRNQYR